MTKLLSGQQQASWYADLIINNQNKSRFLMSPIFADSCNLQFAKKLWGLLERQSSFGLDFQPAKGN